MATRAKSSEYDSLGYPYRRIIELTLNDLTSGSPKGYAKVLAHIESMRGNVEELPRQIEIIWSIKSKRMLYVAINQQVVLQNQESVINETAELLGLSMRMTEDQLTRDMLEATASVYNCTGGQNGDLPSNMSVSDIDNVTSMLATNDAWMILDNKEGENRFGTGPVRDSYVGLGHTKLLKDLNNLNGFLSKWNYPLFKLNNISGGDSKIFSNTTRISLAYA